MIATREVLNVPVAQRPSIIGLSAYKWGGNVGASVELTYSFTTPGSVFPADYPTQYIGDVRVLPDSIKAAFQVGLQAWANVANVTFQQVTDSGASYGDIRIGVSASNPNGGAEAAPPTVYNSSLAGDVWLGPIFGPGQWEMTALHELGHAIFGLTDVSTNPGFNGQILPLSENNQTKTIMSYDGGGLPGPTTPMVLDVLAAQWLYGANIGYHADDDTYSFNQAITSYMTIWDGGGNDTISIAANNKAGIIDLTPGNYSDVGSIVTTFSAAGPAALTKTVGIAFGAVIENAIGGSGGDTIIGNGARNVIRGNGGNDFIDGGAERDTSVYSQASWNFTLNVSGENVIVHDRSGIEGTDTLVSINHILFGDGGALDPTWLVNAARLDQPRFVDLFDMYVAYFNRAPDALGVNYWASRLVDGMTLQQIAKSFFVQPETLAAYPATMTTTQFVTEVYDNALGRTPDAAGLAYWVNDLDIGAQTRDAFMLAIIYGARAVTGSPQDAQYLGNKGSVAKHFALDKGLNDANWAKLVMQNVNADPASVAAANQMTDIFADAAVTTDPHLLLPLVGLA